MGAAGILYHEALTAFAEKIGCGFYILPSSIHEVILVPDSGEVDSENLRSMVIEINSSEVAPEEILSDKTSEKIVANKSFRGLE